MRRAHGKLWVVSQFFAVSLSQHGMLVGLTLPLQPAMSIMLAFAIYLFAYAPSSEPGDSIWGFSKPEEVFGTKLNAVLAALENDAEFLEHLGAASVDQIAAHSLRKGACTCLPLHSQKFAWQANSQRARRLADPDHPALRCFRCQG